MSTTLILIGGALYLYMGFLSLLILSTTTLLALEVTEGCTKQIESLTLKGMFNLVIGWPVLMPIMTLVFSTGLLEEVSKKKEKKQ